MFLFTFMIQFSCQWMAERLLLKNGKAQCLFRVIHVAAIFMNDHVMSIHETYFEDTQEVKVSVLDSSVQCGYREMAKLIGQHKLLVKHEYKR